MRALVVDDDPGVRNIIKDMLVSQQVHVFVAASGKECLEQLQTQKIDVLFTDLKLPDWDGNSLIQQAKWNYPEINAVVVTGYPSLDSSVVAMQRGACDYITKPITRDKIIAALTRAKQRCNALNPSGIHQHDVLDRHRPKRCEIVAESSAMRKMLIQARSIARMNLPVLILGEKGVGKAALARYAHSQSERANGEFLHVLCSGIREERLDALLSDNHQTHGIAEAGDEGSLLDKARGGTLFFDGIDRLPAWAQTKLLHIVDTNEGLTTSSVRLIATAWPDIESAVREARFSEGLYFFLNVASIWIPPLRHRREDIPLLANHFLKVTSQRLGGSPDSLPNAFSDDAREQMCSYDWPGNVRQLAHVVERAVVSATSNEISGDLVAQLIDTNRGLSSGMETLSVPLRGNLRDIERNIVRQVIDRHYGNKAAAARSLGMHRRTIYRLLEEAGESEAAGLVEGTEQGNGNTKTPM